MRHLGIDYGSKAVGLALSDDDGKMGFPHTVLHNTDALLDELTKLIEDEGVKVVVFGESKALDGSDNEIQASIKEFARQLESNACVTVAFEPEYYTTKQARDAQTLMGKGRERADAVAAAIILTSYLERHGNN
ncbi:MAG: Holliday junction resolvase RuvX [Patescibacteria group bacterium UBA2103]